MTEVSIEPFERAHPRWADRALRPRAGLRTRMTWSGPTKALTAPGVTTLVAVVDEQVICDRAGGLQLDIRTRTEGYYERFGASRSLGYRLMRADLGLTPRPARTGFPRSPGTRPTGRRGG